MHVSKERTVHAKSYTSIYDLFGSRHFNNIAYKNPRKHSKDLSVFQATCGDAARAKLHSNNSLRLNSTQYITSEKYHLLNKDFSYKSLVRSTSTIFYDLDDVAKRHSFHCLNDISASNVNLLKVMKIPLNTNGFNGKADAIVQECATQIQPKIVPRDSIEINTRKIKKSFPDEPFLSSEIFLRDDDYDFSEKQYYNKDITNRQQKFWSFAKYRTEYTNPVNEEKKRKKKDRGKRTEDPCPCQLFSYACPCTDKKSLTELARNSKSLTVADQITSTANFLADERTEGKSNKTKKWKNQPPREDKLLSTDYVEVIDKYEVLPTKTEAIVNNTMKQDIPTLKDNIQMDNVSIRSKVKQVKKHRKITCPNCKENVEVILSTTDEEESLKYDNSSVFRIKNSSKSSYRSPKNSNRHKSVIAEDSCGHDPQCELIPVCQILPTDNVYLSHKCIRKQSNPKTTPKIIRITKACRHHPPCTVVPSCQRANVLKNNCEFIPPCLHRPRCVNLPLCVPLKNLHYDELMKNADDESGTCPHIPRCKYVPECQYEPVASNLENHLNIVSQVQNACEFLSEFQQPKYSLSPKMTVCAQNNVSSINKVVSPTTCHCCKSNKSCQYNCPDCKCSNNVKEMDSNEAVVFIRDVGCQFRNKRYSSKDSDQSKISSASFDFVDVKMGNYYNNVHTLRCEDKFTNPMVDEDLSETSVSIISLEVDSHCPTHGERGSRKHSERATGFIPKQNTSPYVAYTTQRSQVMPSQMYSGNNELNDARTLGQGYSYSTFPVKSHRSFMKGKYKKMFAVKRRRKPKASSHGFVSHSRRQICVPNCN